MTDATNTTPENTAPAAPGATQTAPAVNREPLPEFGQNVLEQLTELKVEHDSNDATLRAAKGDSQGLLETLRETSENPDVKARREKIEQIDEVRFKLSQEIDEILKPEVEDLKSEASSKVDGLEDKQKDIRSRFSTARKYFKDTWPEWEDALPVIKGSSASASSAGGGEGIRRIRHRNWIVGDKSFKNTAGIAQHIGTSTPEVQAAFFSAAGSEDAKNWADEVEFTVTGKDNETFNVKSVSSVPAEKAVVTPPAEPEVPAEEF